MTPMPNKRCPLCHGAGLIKETAAEAVCNPERVYAALVKKGIHRKKQEHFVALLVDTQNQILETKIVFIGTIDRSLVHAREVFRDAVKKSAYGVILAHNHPSGFLAPSPEDLRTTEDLIEAGRILGIQVIDHLIISKSGYRSLRESTAYGWMFEKGEVENA